VSEKIGISDSQSVREILARESAGGVVTLRGWVRTARHSKGVSFLEVSDGSCFAGLQVVAAPELENFESELCHLQTGCAVSATGELVDSLGKGQRFELQARRIDVVGAVAEDYPLQKKRHSFEFLRTLAHLRPRTNTLGAVFRVRNAAAAAIHEFFQERGFLLLPPPIITSSDAEGAGQMFRVSTLDAGDPPRDEGGSVDFGRDFFGRETFLTVSGQLEAEISALALSNVYTFGPPFRAENSYASGHLAEFWMIGPGLAFCELDGSVDLAESVLKHVFTRVLDRCPDDMAFFNERIDKTVLETLHHIVETPFERISYTDAIEILERSGETFEFRVKWCTDLQGGHGGFLTA